MLSVFKFECEKKLKIGKSKMATVSDVIYVAVVAMETT